MTLALRSLLAASVLSLAACAQAGPGSTTVGDAEFGEAVRAYLLENPEVIGEALEALDRKQKEEQLSRTVNALADMSDQIFRDPRDYSVGPKDAKVQLVEFFDYNCGFCKRSVGFIEDAKVKYGDDVRVIYKELPVLSGPNGSSFTAARAALASARQGKYSAMHTALMAEKGGLTEARILDVAERIGLDVEQLKTDMADPAIRRQIDDNLQIASTVPALTGTPFFVINDQFVVGGNMARLQAAIESELEG